MPLDAQVDVWKIMVQQVLGDPILLVGLFAPLLILGVALYFRLRLTRRLTAMSNRNAQALSDNAVRWEESALRSDKVIALLTEIRDHMAKMAPLPPGQEPKTE
jgi:hypothetical protein